MAQPNDGANNPMRPVGTPSGPFPAIPQIDYGVELSKPPSPQPVIDYAGVILQRMQAAVNAEIAACVANARLTASQMSACVQNAIDTIIGVNNGTLQSLSENASAAISHFTAAAWENAASAGIRPQYPISPPVRTNTALYTDSFAPVASQASYSPIVPSSIQQQLQPPQQQIIQPPAFIGPPSQQIPPPIPTPIPIVPPPPFIPPFIPPPQQYIPPVPIPPPPPPPLPPGVVISANGTPCTTEPNPPGPNQLGACTSGGSVWGGMVSTQSQCFATYPSNGEWSPISQCDSTITQPPPPPPPVPPPPIPTVPPPPTGICPPSQPCPVVPVVRVEACRTYDIITDIARGQLTEENARIASYFGQTGSALTANSTAQSVVDALIGLLPAITADEARGDYFNQGPLVQQLTQ